MSLFTVGSVRAAFGGRDSLQAAIRARMRLPYVEPATIVAETDERVCERAARAIVAQVRRPVGGRPRLEPVSVYRAGPQLVVAPRFRPGEVSSGVLRDPVTFRSLRVITL